MSKAPKLRFPGFNREWIEKTLGDIVDFHKGKGLSKANLSDSENGFPCILYGELYTKYKEVITNVASKADYDNKGNMFWSKNNDVLIPSSGETAEDIASGTATILLDDVALGGDINVLRPYQDIIKGPFLSYSLNYPKQKDFQRIAQGASVIHLYASTLKDLTIKIPTPEEQAKITNFFSLIDSKIEKQEQKVEALKEYKKGFMQKIFSQEIRFKDENGEEYPEWKEILIGDVFDERSENGYNDLELVSVTINEGVKKRSEIEIKDNSSEDKSKYKIVEMGDIVYNSMRMWQGANGVSPYRGITSPAYTVLKNKINICSIFFGYLFKTPKMIYQFRRYSQGLTSDTWNLKYPQLTKITIKVPVFTEQIKIANFLSILDQKIDKERKKLEAFNDMKMGLLQQMFV